MKSEKSKKSRVAILAVALIAATVIFTAPMIKANADTTPTTAMPAAVGIAPLMQETFNDGSATGVYQYTDSLGNKHYYIASSGEYYYITPSGAVYWY